MAISRDKKQALVAELTELLQQAKATAFAHYNGLTVADLQELRKTARQSHVVIKVVKNRLVRVALSGIDTYAQTATDGLTGQLVYAISAEDEVMPAKVLHDFAKSHPALELAGGISAEGLALSADEAKALAGLPSKEQLVAEVVTQLLSPVHDTVSGLGGNLHGLLDGIEAHAA